MHAGDVIFIAAVWLCAGLFFGLGVLAGRKKDPMFFYSGVKVDPSVVRDIPAYNRENARMWKVYSIPFFLCGPLVLLSPLLAAAGIALASTLGLFLLVRHYHKIERRYILKK